MAQFDPPDRPADDDALDLFGAELGVSYEEREQAFGSTAPPGAISLDQVWGAGGIGFVEGVAAIQALCASLQAARSTQVPDIKGVFLTSSGEVVAVGPPSGDTAPRELARILNDLVSADSMPPAGRLFVGRWSTSDSVRLEEFIQELDYFARPNGQELLTAIYSSSRGKQAPLSAPRTPSERPLVLPEARNTVTLRKAAEEQAKRDPRPLRRWMNAHRRELVAAVAVLSAVLVTGVVAWLWPVFTPVVAKQIEKIGGRTLESQKIELTKPDNSRDAETRSSKKTSPATTRSKKSPPLAEHGETTEKAVSLAPPIQEASDNSVAPELPPLPSATVPDLRVYSDADGGVQPPRLRSAGIPDFLLRGFERRTNVVELIVSERGQVQQARMLNEPQRMPDIMVLSRVKELLFEPAVKNGVAVRYKMILKWDVTP